MNYKIALNSHSELVTNTMTEMMKELGCRTETVNYESSNVSYFSDYVKSGAFDLGVSVEDTSEKMMLVDDKGRIVTEDMFIALISIIFFRTVQGGTIVVPISASSVVERIAGENNGSVLRTKTSHQDIMANILGSEIKEEMLDQFTMHFDAIAGLARILDFMSINNHKLSDLIDMIPDFHIHKQEVECPWYAKGKVIKQIIQENKNGNIETLEGVKIYRDEGWVLVLPDAEQPVCRVISEGFTSEFAEELSSIYINKIREISRG